MASKVYFIKNVTAENVVKMYDKLGVKLPGKVAVKVHSGEEGNRETILINTLSFLSVMDGMNYLMWI